MAKTIKECLEDLYYTAYAHTHTCGELVGDTLSDISTLIREAVGEDLETCNKLCKHRECIERHCYNAAKVEIRQALRKVGVEI